jgi:hypothetical protein
MFPADTYVPGGGGVPIQTAYDFVRARARTAGSTRDRGSAPRVACCREVAGGGGRTARPVDGDTSWAKRLVTLFKAIPTRLESSTLDAIDVAFEHE